MSSRLATALGRLGSAVAVGLERMGVIERGRLRETLGLASPRVVTGFATMSKNTADLAIIGFVLGAPAVAGLAFAFAYWQLAKFISIGLAGGTVALVSQNYGGEEFARAALVVKASLLVAVAIVVPIVAVFVLFAEPLVSLVGGTGDALAYGVVYLVVTAFALPFEFFNMITSRTYAGVGDTVTPMVVRVAGAALNIVLTAGFVLGAGMGVLGAALGTTISIAAIAVVLSWGMSGRSYFGRGASPVPVGLSGRWIDGELIRQLLRVSTPLMGRRLAEALLVFPLLWIASTFGSTTVAALEVGRRVRSLINSFSWGFSIAASTLVGQRLGAGEESLAETYGREVIKLSIVTYLVAAVLVIAAAEPIASVFVDEPAAVAATTTFVIVAALSAIPLGVDGSATGSLRGAGDTRWPFLATLAGSYLGALPIAALGLVTPLGAAALYVALVVETSVPAGLNLYRFRSNKWQVVSRRYRPTSSTTEDGAG